MAKLDQFRLHHMASAQVRLDNVSLAYRSRPRWLGGQSQLALSNASLTIDRDNVAIVGPSGAGKSSIIELLFGLKQASRGEVYICDRPVSGMSLAERRAQGRHIQLIPQEPKATLNPFYSVAQLLAEPLKNLSKTPLGQSEIDQRIHAVLEEVGLSPALATRPSAELSVGQAQRVAIARAIIVNPCVLVADEPTSSLDPISRERVIQLLQRLQRRHQMRLVLVTHDLDAAARLCEQLVVLDKGHIVEQGEVHTVLSSPQHPTTQALLHARTTLNNPQQLAYGSTP